MNNSINALLNSLSKIGEIRKADKSIGELSSKSDYTMTVGTRRRIYHYFPKNRQQLQEIILQKILDEGYECNLNDIDISGAGEYMYGLFSDGRIFGNFWFKNGIDMKIFNGHLEEWDVSNVKVMNAMFAGCRDFNRDISGWDVSNVKYTMISMFEHCSKFDQDLSAWDVSNVKEAYYIFKGCLKMQAAKENIPPKFRYNFNKI